MPNRLNQALALRRWLVFPLILFAVSVALQLRGTFEPYNDRILDQRMERTPVPASGEVGIIAIDSQSLRDVGTWPWSRSIHSEILDRLVALGAGIVFFDIDFAFPFDPEGDAAFSDALDRAGGATLLATFSQIGLDGETLYNQPHAPFNARSWPATVTLPPNAYGQIRDYPTGAFVDGAFVPSASAQIAGSYASDTAHFRINFGISHDAIPTFAVSDLLDGTVTREDVEGRSFLVGGAAAELGDHFTVPLQGILPGVMVHAIAAETLLQGASVLHVSSVILFPLLFLMICALHGIGRQNAWGVVGLATISSIGIEVAGMWVYASSYSSLPTAMFHPALITMAIVRLAKSVGLSGVLIKRQEVQMQNAERLRQHIFEHSSDGFVAINGQGKIVFQNDFAKSLLGDDTVPVPLLSIADRLLKQDGAQTQLEYLELGQPNALKSIEVHANASERQNLDDSLNLVSEPLALMTLRDVTDIKQNELKIAYLSRHDDRTSALRRHSVANAIEMRTNRGERIAVAAIAIGRLTAINATLGRGTGDQIIAEAARRLMQSPFDLGEVARLEGNVLGVIIPASLTEESVLERCNSVRELLMAPYDVASSKVQIGLSIGYFATDDSMAISGEAYLSRAQDALAKARQASSTYPVAYDHADGARLDRSRRLEQALSQALERDEFYLLYQPQYRLSDHALIGVEALVRWNSFEFGDVSPVEFIPIAESSGFITELGRFVLEQSIKDALRLPEHIAMSPNVSVFQLLSDDLPLRVAALLDQHGLPADRLCLELTESAYLSPNSEAVKQMHAIQSLGVSWALDDFGTGYSSLSYLKDLPFSKIKLDRAFVSDLVESQDAQTTIKALVKLVHGYDKTLLCEGVETQEEAVLLAELGCDNVQGYFFGRPMLLDEVAHDAAGTRCSLAS